MKKIMLLLAMCLVVVAGITLVVWFFVVPKNVEKPVVCVKGMFQIVTLDMPQHQGIFIGEQMLCARDWQITAIYGPSIEAYLKCGIEIEPFKDNETSGH